MEFRPAACRCTCATPATGRACSTPSARIAQGASEEDSMKRSIALTLGLLMATLGGCWRMGTTSRRNYRPTPGRQNVLHPLERPRLQGRKAPPIPDVPAIEVVAPAADVKFNHAAMVKSSPAAAIRTSPRVKVGPWAELLAKNGMAAFIVRYRVSPKYHYHCGNPGRAPGPCVLCAPCRGMGPGSQTPSA